MNNSRKRLLISFILNIIMIILFISSIIIEIIDIHNNPKSVYQNVQNAFAPILCIIGSKSTRILSI